MDLEATVCEIIRVSAPFERHSALLNPLHTRLSQDSVPLALHSLWDGEAAAQVENYKPVLKAVWELLVQT